MFFDAFRFNNTPTVSHPRNSEKHKNINFSVNTFEKHCPDTSKITTRPILKCGLWDNNNNNYKNNNSVVLSSRRKRTPRRRRRTRSGAVLGVVLWWVWFCTSSNIRPLLWKSLRLVKKTEKSWKNTIFEETCQSDNALKIILFNKKHKNWNSCFDTV